MSLARDMKKSGAKLTSEEKMMAVFIKYEQIFKKYRFHLLVIILLVAAYITYSFVDSNLKQSNLKKANIAFLTLQDDPSDVQALAELQKNNEKLYQLYMINQKLNSDNITDNINQLKNYSASVEIKDITSYHTHLHNQTLAEYDGSYKDLADLIRGYHLLKSGEIDQARVILSNIPKESELSANVNILLHYIKAN